MKNLFSVIFILFTVYFAVSFSACMDDEFTSSPDVKLSFSTDTVMFDTVFTTIGSSTRSFLIHNRGSKAVRVNSIYLAGGSTSPFFINVDGSNGTSFSDVEIRGKDSLFVFVEVKINPTDRNNPILFKDSLVCLTNGNRQDVKLIAYGQDVEIFKGKVFDSDTTLTSHKPFLIYDSLVVNDGVTLTIKEGAKLHFHDKASLLVRGKLSATGTSSDFVHFRGDRLDNLFVNLPYDYLAGQWGGVRFGKDSYDNTMEYVYMRGTTSGIAIDSTDITRQKLTILNSVIHNSSNDLISSVMAKISIANTQLSNAGGAILRLLGGNLEVVHTTIANYYSFAVIRSPLVIMSNYITHADKSTKDYPIEKANFYNTVIYGTYNDVEIEDCPTANYPFSYLFSYCSLRSRDKDNANFTNVLWATDPKFRMTGTDYLYDYRLGENSPVRNAGDPIWVSAYPTDMLGNSRVGLVAPDMGAYQYETKDPLPEK